MSEAIDRARSVIESRLAELDAEAKGLERALKGLGEGSRGRPTQRRRRQGKKPAAAPPAKRRGRPKAAAPAKATTRPPRKRKGAKRAPRGQRREQLLAALKANRGARPAELAAEIGISSNQVHALIAKARKDKAIVRKGKGWAVKG
jgi:hypothetical protein